MGEDLLLERVTAAAEEPHLSQNTLTAYRRTWLNAIAWAAAEGLALETLPLERAGEFYEEVTHGRSASHHLQVKAAVALLDLLPSLADRFMHQPTPIIGTARIALSVLSEKRSVCWAVLSSGGLKSL